MLTLTREDIASLYKDRFYHNLDHLNQVQESLSEFIEITSRIGIVICYHDLIYDVKSKLNEELSAKIACFDYIEDKDFIYTAIIATRDHKATGDREIDLFLDADMSILASEEEVYDKYLKGIREEYSCYTDKEFSVGRKKFLTNWKGFITKEYKRYNDKAFSNIELELKCL